mgnify:CR=1 FL=1
MAPAGLSALDYDVLACVVAPEAEPKLGWLFQSLQAGAPTPYPTLALLHELLARHTGQTVEQIAADFDRDRFMTAQEAVEYGLVDQLIEKK